MLAEDRQADLDHDIRYQGEGDGVAAEKLGHVADVVAEAAEQAAEGGGRLGGIKGVKDGENRQIFDSRPGGAGSMREPSQLRVVQRGHDIKQNEKRDPAHEMA